MIAPFNVPSDQPALIIGKNSKVQAIPYPPFSCPPPIALSKLFPNSNSRTHTAVRGDFRISPNDALSSYGEGGGGEVIVMLLLEN